MTGTRYLPLVLAALVSVLMLSVVAQTTVEPWSDEAMLLTNLLLPDLNILAPLPHYEQAAPVGYVWLSRMLLDFFGSNPPFHVLRLLSTAFIGLGIALLLSLRPIRRDGLAATILVAFLLGEPMVWIYASEIKQYSAEFFGSALVLACGLPLSSRNDTGALALFLAAVVIAGLVSFTVPVVVAGMLAALVLYRLTAKDPQVRAFSPAFMFTGALALFYVAALYLLLNRGLVAWQIQAYAHVYNPGTDQGIATLALKRINGVLQAVVNAFGTTWLSATQRLLQHFGLPVGISYYAIRLIALALFAALARIAYKRAPAAVMLTSGAFAAMAVLQISGFLSLSYPRHVIFLIPFSAMVTAIAVSHLLREQLPSIARITIAGAAMTASLAFGTGTALGRQTQEVGRLLAHIRDTAPDVPVWIHSTGQPVFDLLAPQPMPVLGRIDTTSGVVPWQVRGGTLLFQDSALTADPDYPDALATSADGLPALWLLFNNDASAQERIPFLEIAAKVVGPCKTAIEIRSAGLYFCSQN